MLPDLSVFPHLFTMSVETFSVGERVRITSLHNSTRNRAMIACCNSNSTSGTSDNVYDVLYDSMKDCFGKRIDEELSVKQSRIEVLQSFEAFSLSAQSSSQKKEYGNILFKLRDFDAAVIYYKSALDSLLLNKTVHSSSDSFLYLTEYFTPTSLSILRRVFHRNACNCYQLLYPQLLFVSKNCSP